MITLLAFVVAIGVLVVVHELGHYWAARCCGVKVLRFSVGFGKVLYARKFGRGETEWALSAIPLGGYVKMLDEREAPVEARERERAFNRRPVWQRMVIVAAGPLANLLLAVILYWILFSHGVAGIRPVLGDVPPQSAAAAARLEPGETVVSVGGKPVPSWQELNWALLDAAMHGGTVTLEGRTVRGQTARHALDLGGVAPADLDGDFLRKLGLVLYQPPIPAVIGKLSDGGVAQRAGLRERDRIAGVDGRPVAEWKDLVEAVRGHPGSLLHLQIERGGSLVGLDVTPETVSEEGRPVGRIGAAPRVEPGAFEAMVVQVRYPPADALVHAVRKTWETAAVSLRMMGEMVIGRVSLKNLSGPITIADYAGQSAQLGVTAYLGFLALISISLGVLNLLPVPLLDGGHLLYHTAELLKGSPVSDKAWEIGQSVGIALLVTLMAFALYNDISRLILG